MCFFHDNINNGHMFYQMLHMLSAATMLLTLSMCLCRQLAADLRSAEYYKAEGLRKCQKADQRVERYNRYSRNLQEADCKRRIVLENEFIDKRAVLDRQRAVLVSTV